MVELQLTYQINKKASLFILSDFTINKSLPSFVLRYQTGPDASLVNLIRHAIIE